MAGGDVWTGRAYETGGQLAVRFLSESGEGERPYLIAHDRTRQVVYENMSRARRKVYHRRALWLLEAENSRPAELAYHALAAQEHEKGWRYSVLAGEEARYLDDVKTAAQQYEAAFALTQKIDLKIDEADWLSWGNGLGQAYELQFEMVQALAVYERLLALGDERQSRPLQLAGLVGMSGVLVLPYDAFDEQRGRRCAQQANPLEPFQSTPIGDRHPANGPAY